jgi:glycosyltransferase involved in cell wall biosynthesis
MSEIKELITDGIPSREFDHRPFFSIIIPCYNSRKTIGELLASIEAQGMNDDIEIILSDDHSPESYQDVVDPFRERMRIIQTQTDYNFAPGNTREKGVQYATGEWLAFADHDDLYIVDTLSQIKEIVQETGEKYYIISNFLEVDPTTHAIIRKHVHTRNWNHAKFYNLDNFWKAFDIHFKKDLLTHEDIYISSVVNCACNKYNTEPLLVNMFTYIWNARPTSLSRAEYKNRNFLEVFFRDYIASTGDLYLERWERRDITEEYAVRSVINIILFCYFYTQGFKFQKPNDWLEINDYHARDFLMRCLDTFEYFNTDYIWNYCGANYAEFYRGVRDVAYIGSGGFIEDMDFRRWLDYMQDEANIPDLENYNAHKDDPVNTTMVKEMSKVDTSAEVTNEVPVVDNTVAKDGKIMYNFK